MDASLSPPRLLPSGDRAIAVEFAKTIDDAANQRVLTLDRALNAAKVEGVTETVPTYRSLLVHYDPVRIDFDALGAKLLALAQAPPQASGKARRWRVPVAYGGENGIDLEEVAKSKNMTPDEVVARHSGGDYRVAMVGFTPGWSYLSGLDKSLHMPRRPSPARVSRRPERSRSAACRPASNAWRRRAAGTFSDERPCEPFGCIAIPCS